MPSTIPYDPSLVLASVVEPVAVQAVERIAKAQAKVDAAQEALNSLLASRRSLDLTKIELANLGIGTEPIDEKLVGLNKSIKDTGAEYARQKVQAENDIRDIRSEISMVNSQIESPVDFVKTEIKNLPLAADSLNMDVQYFSMDAYGQNAESYVKAVSNFVSGQTSFLGNQIQAQATKATQKQASQQEESHKLVGTVVVSVSCTHKNAAILAPCVLDVDRGIKVWNKVFPKKPFKPASLSEADLMKVIEGTDDKEGKAGDDGGVPKYSIISGTTFGSSFVGMVHILKASNTSVNQNLESLATSLQTQLDVGGFLQSRSGGFGINASIGDEIKQLLSAQNVTCHVTLICMGVIPSIVSSNIKIGVESFAKFDPKSSMEAIATLQNATVGDQDSVKTAADAARSGAQMLSMKAGDVKSALSALAEVDDGNNKVVDINSMMTALEDYLKKAISGTAGVPISYYLKDITKDMLGQMWATKYLPNKVIGAKPDEEGKKDGRKDQTPSKPAGKGKDVDKKHESESEDNDRDDDDRDGDR